MKQISIDQFEAGVLARPTRPVMPDVSVSEGPKWSSGNLSVLCGLKFLSSLRSPNCSFLPNREGWIEYRPVRNVRNGKPVYGASQLAMKARQDEAGWPSEWFVSEAALNAACKAGVKAFVKKGEKGVVFPAAPSSAGGPQNVTRWFNAAQVEGFEALSEFFSQRRNGRGARPGNPRFSGEVSLNERSLSLESYLAQVLSAGEAGKRIYVSEDAALKFTEAAEKKFSVGWSAPKADQLAFFKAAKTVGRLKAGYDAALRPKRRDSGSGWSRSL